MIRTFSELKRLKTFEERFEYLKLSGSVGESTFGFDRYLNQALYRSKEWKDLRNEIIIRDNGCDLGIEGREINDRIIIHHMNPLTADDVINRSDFVYDPNYLICVSFITHDAIHYGDISLLPKLPIERKPGDTTLW
ncbi:hypothetical protein [Turicimonas muris]|uniref:hypothetical protein n=1 Tax=Turicimonas muris TaxID=1796652 RepID=UPI0026226262|nr:hypothetical protein [Turicimonas muris]